MKASGANREANSAQADGASRAPVASRSIARRFMVATTVACLVAGLVPGTGVARELSSGSTPRAAATGNSAGPTMYPAWTRQFGSSDDDEATKVVVDAADDVFVVGTTNGVLPGQTATWANIGAFVRAYAADGSERWTSQIDATRLDPRQVLEVRIVDAAVDTGGNLVVVGSTNGVLPGQTTAGGYKAFVRSYAPNGTELWTHEFGSQVGARAISVAVDSVDAGSGVLVWYSDGGDGFMRHYSADGTERWTRPIGSVSDGVVAFAADAADNFYLAGYAAGPLPGQTFAGRLDAFVTAYHADGTARWTREFGAAGDDEATGVAVDAAGNVLVAGFAGSTLDGQSLNGSVAETFVRSYTSDGTERWTREFGAEENAIPTAVAVDRASNVFVSGWTMTHAHSFVRSYQSTGAERLNLQLDSYPPSTINDVAVDGAGNIVVVGWTHGGLAGQTDAGGSDAFVRKYVSCAGTPITVEAPPSVFAIAQAATPGFEAAWSPACVATAVAPSSDSVLYDLQVGLIDVAVSSRALTPAEGYWLWSWQIGGDAMVLAVQDSSAMSFIHNITSAQVAGIYSGSITNWSALGGPDRPIVPRSDSLGSDARADMLRLFGVSDASEQATVAWPRLASSAEEASAVIANPYQIVYTTLSNAGKAGLKVLTLDGVPPTTLTVEIGAYPKQRQFFAAVRKIVVDNNIVADRNGNSDLVLGDDYINYLLTPAGTNAVAASRFVPVPLPATPPIPDWDVNLDGSVGVNDLGSIIGNWDQSSTAGPGWIRADVNNDGAIGINDIGQVIAKWRYVGFVAPN